MVSWPGFYFGSPAKHYNNNCYVMLGRITFFVVKSYYRGFSLCWAQLTAQVQANFEVLTNTIILY